VFHLTKSPVIAKACEHTQSNLQLPSERETTLKALTIRRTARRDIYGEPRNKTPPEIIALAADKMERRVPNTPACNDHHHHTISCKNKYALTHWHTESAVAAAGGDAEEAIC
jgi:hypothetical protein